MKLSELHVENYGIFRDRRLTFGGGFQLIHGPNETGKSTLLMLLREVFFGFADRNPYAFDDHAGKMAATVTMTTAKGRDIKFCRQKKRKDAVVGSFLDTGEGLDEPALVRLLDGASRNTFESLFAFSLSDLAAGQEGLLGAAGQEALFGSGVGGLKRFHSLQKSIDAQLENLFKPKAKNPAINSLIDQIATNGKAIDESIVKPAYYEDLCQQREDLAKNESRIRDDLQRCGREKNRVSRLAKALPVWKELVLAEAEVQEIDAPDGLPESLGADFEQARQIYAQAEDDLRDAEEKIAVAESELAKVRLNPQVLAQDAEINAVFREAAGMRACREALPRLQGDAALLRPQAQAAMAALHTAWTLGDLDRLRADVPLRQRVEQMAKDAAETANLQRTLGATRKERVAKLEGDRQAIERLEAIPAVPRLEALRAREPQYRSDLEIAGEGALNAQKASQRIDQLWARLLANVAAPAERMAELALPFSSAVEPFRDRFDRAESTILDVRGRIDVARDDIKRLEGDLRQLAVRESIPDRQQLLECRRRRDAVWRLIRRQYVEGQEVAAEAEAFLGDLGQTLPDAFERELSAADQLADQRQEKAELVARHDQLALEIAVKGQSLGDLEELLAEREAALYGIQAEWTALWAPLGIAPQSPRVMLEWLDVHRDWHEACHARDLSEAKRQAACERVAAFERELRDALGAVGDVESLLPIARQRAAEAAEATSQRKLLDQGVLDQQRQLAEIDAELAALGPRQTQWRDDWQALLGELGFPPAWDAPTVERILAGLGQVRRDFEEVVRLENEATRSEAALEAFAQRVAKLDLLEDASAFAMRPEDMAERFQNALDQARQARDRHELLSQQLEELRGRSASKRQILASAAARIAACQELAGVANDEDFRRVLACADRRRRLRDKIESATGELRRLAEGEALESFLASLALVDADQLAAESVAAQERYAALDEEYRQAISSMALIDKQVRDLDKTGQTPQIVQHRESLYATLREKAGDYAVLKFAAAVLRQSLVRFEKEHQPAILADAGAMLARLTRGRYARICTRLDENGSLEVEDARGAAKTPGQLSTGTREQLHLALRLAHARHYCRNLEPLPLVMDDVLVNFDDARAAAALELLAELSGQMQVLFLTCHDATVARIEKIVPNAARLALATD